jgi:acetyl esterase/lipase/acyl-coenzyme A synthetase/AMP-(fatty) acid ligase
MDVFKPIVPEGTELPVIVIIHGGGLFMGDRGLERPYSRLLAHKGYLVFSLEYRLAPKATIGQQLDDVCAGMDIVGSKLVDYDVDFGRIFLMADSAGAYLACYVTAMHESEKLQNIIGYKPSRMVFAAVGFMSGMFYTNKMLSEQIFGDKRDDKKFLKYMNPEHPEIVKNLPPAFLLTSCGDSFNNFSLRFNKALKKAGRVSKLLYLGDEELQHVFTITNPEHPRSIEATDKMLAWFEEQAEIRRTRRKKDPKVEGAKKAVQKRIADGSITDQKVWRNLKERIVADPATLKKTAIIDCTREYSYEQMLAEWERYARAFTGVGIGYENKSRVALCGTITAEPLFALYGLNMVGAEVSLFSYPDFLPHGMWKDMIEKEHITDLVISDIMVTSEVWEEIKEVSKKCGLRNVILMHSLMGGPAVGPAELVFNEYNYHMLKRRPDTVFMDELCEKYRNTPVKYDESTGERIAFITHTSGTTNGTRKLLPYTDKLFNGSIDVIPGSLRGMVKGIEEGKQLRIIQLFDFSSIMALAGQLNGAFITGETVVLTFFGFMHPKFIRAVDYYNISLMFITGFMIDKWIDSPDIDDIDFSSLMLVALAGGYTSPQKLEKYKSFFEAHGFRRDIVTGYGMSEAGGKPLVIKADSKKDVIGTFDDPDEVRIKDENDGKFYRPDEGPRTGLLYRMNKVRCDNKLDGEVLYEYTNIDGRDFLCTNDLVRVNEDCSISFAGRADKYFVNNEGLKFDSGIVDNCMAAHRAIDRCAVVPVMEKRIHDTVPVLYVIPAEKGEGAAERIRQAFVDVYVKDRKIGADNIPTQFMIVDDIPLNANGKLDIYRITRERLEGDAYNIVPVMTDGKLTDIKAEHVEQVNSTTAGTLPQGMENNSAYNVFDIFTTPVKKGGQSFSFGDIFRPWKLFMPETEWKDKGFKLPEMSEETRKTLFKYGNRLAGIPNGRKAIDFDFED